MQNNHTCPKCGSEVILSGSVSCLCDKIFCMGKYCGANKLYSFYECTNAKCKNDGIPQDTKEFYNKYLPKT